MSQYNPCPPTNTVSDLSYNCTAPPEKYEFKLFSMGLCMKDPIINGTTNPDWSKTYECWGKDKRPFIVNNGTIDQFSDCKPAIHIKLESGIKTFYIPQEYVKRPPNGEYVASYIIIDNHIKYKGKYQLEGVGTFFSTNRYLPSGHKVATIAASTTAAAAATTTTNYYSGTNGDVEIGLNDFGINQFTYPRYGKESHSGGYIQQILLQKSTTFIATSPENASKILIVYTFKTRKNITNKILGINIRININDETRPTGFHVKRSASGLVNEFNLAPLKPEVDFIDQSMANQLRRRSPEKCPGGTETENYIQQYWRRGVYRGFWYGVKKTRTVCKRYRTRTFKFSIQNRTDGATWYALSGAPNRVSVTSNVANSATSSTLTHVAREGSFAVGEAITVSGHDASMTNISITSSVATSPTSTTITHSGLGSRPLVVDEAITVSGHIGDTANTAMNQVFTVAVINSSTEAVLTGTGMTTNTYNTGTIVFATHSAEMNQTYIVNSVVSPTNLLLTGTGMTPGKYSGAARIILTSGFTEENLNEEFIPNKIVNTNQVPLKTFK